MTHPSPALSEQLSAAVAAVSPSLVTVHGTRSPVTASGLAWGPDLVVSTHSGTWDDQGLRVHLPDGRRLPATVVGRDPTTDLLVLSVPGADLPVPARRSLDGLSPGALAVAVGRRRGAVRASWGHVTEVGGPWLSPAGAEVDGLVEVDAALPRGLTGSALVDLEGRVLGVNTRLLRRGGTTVPVATVQRIVDHVQAHGSVAPGWLGVSVLPVALPAAAAQATGHAEGLILLEVQADGPAAAAGWLQGDVLVELDGAPLPSPRDLQRALGPQRVGQATAARLVRAGEPREAAVTVGPRPEGRATRPRRPGRGPGGRGRRWSGWD